MRVKKSSKKFDYQRWYYLYSSIYDDDVVMNKECKDDKPNPAIYLEH